MLVQSTLSRIIFISAAGVFIAALMVLLSYGLSNRSSPTGRSGKQLVGSVAPVLDGQTIRGEHFSYMEFDESYMVINFWASWCPPCRQETPSFEKLWRLYQSDDIVFLGINVQDSKEEALKYLEEFDVTFPNLLDADGSITVDYGVTGLPVTFFVNPEKEIISRWVGSISEKRLDNMIRDMIGMSIQLGGQSEVNESGLRVLR